jgi:hypothetical protein
MNNRIKELMKEANDPSYAADGPLERFNPEKFVELLVNDCIEAVKNTPRHCAYTTFQLDLVECTITKSVETLRERYKNE